MGCWVVCCLGYISAISISMVITMAIDIITIQVIGTVIAMVIAIGTGISMVIATVIAIGTIMIVADITGTTRRQEQYHEDDTDIDYINTVDVSFNIAGE
jgi:hypothetical protein